MTIKKQITKKILWTIAFFLVTFSIYYVTIIEHGNAVKHYVTTNESEVSIRLQQGDVFKQNVVINNEYLELQAISIEVIDCNFGENDYVLVSFLGEVYKYYQNEGVGKVEIPVVESADCEAEIIIQVFSESGWIDLKMDPVTESVYLEKSYDVQQLTHIGKIWYGLFTILFWIVVLVMIYLIIWKEYEGKALYLFLMMLELFLAISLRDVTLILNPQAFAEQIGTHYYHSVHSGILQSMFTTEAGYCAAGKRLIAYLVCLTKFGRMHYVLITNIVLVFSAAFSCGLYINFDWNFGKDNRKIGYVLSLYLIMIALACSSNFLYIDQGYWGFPIILYMFLKKDMESMNRKTYVLALIISVIFCITQGHYAMLLPYSLIYVIVNKKMRNRIYGVCIASGAFLQFVISYFAGDTSGWENNDIFNLKGYVSSFYVELTKVFARIWGINNIGYINAISICIIMVILFGFTLYLFLQRRNAQIKTIIDSNIILLWMLLGIEVGFMHITSPSFIYRNNQYLKSRYELFLIITMIVLVVCMGGIIYKFFNTEKLKVIMCSVILILITCGCVDEYRYNYYGNDYVTDRVTDWENTASYIVDNDYYFAKLDPYEWGYTNYYYFAREKDGPIEDEQSDIIAVFVNNVDISRKICIRMRDSEGDTLCDMRSTSANNKSHVCFYFDEPVNDVAEIEFYDMESGDRLYLGDYTFAIRDFENVFIPRG
ncbi:MAG: hypothetical protein ACI4F0_10220 [Agathobacter sp.]